MVMVIAMVMVMVIAMVMAMVMACTLKEVADTLIAVSSARVLLSKGLFGSHRFCLYSCWGWVEALAWEMSFGWGWWWWWFSLLNDGLCFQEVYAEVVKLILLDWVSYFRKDKLAGYGKEKEMYGPVSNTWEQIVFFFFLYIFCYESNIRFCHDWKSLGSVRASVQ